MLKDHFEEILEVIKKLKGLGLKNYADKLNESYHGATGGEILDGTLFHLRQIPEKDLDPALWMEIQKLIVKLQRVADATWGKKS